MYGHRADVTHHWWMASTFLNPIGITIHSNKLKGVDTAVSGMSLGCMHIWKKLFIMSMVAQIFPLAQSFRILSM